MSSPGWSDFSFMDENGNDGDSTPEPSRSKASGKKRASTNDDEVESGSDDEGNIAAPKKTKRVALDKKLAKKTAAAAPASDDVGGNTSQKKPKRTAFEKKTPKLPKGADGLVTKARINTVCEIGNPLKAKRHAKARVSAKQRVTAVASPKGGGNSSDNEPPLWRPLSGAADPKGRLTAVIRSPTTKMGHVEFKNALDAVKRDKEAALKMLQQSMYVVRPGRALKRQIGFCSQKVLNGVDVVTQATTASAFFSVVYAACGGSGKLPAPSQQATDLAVTGKFSGTLEGFEAELHKAFGGTLVYPAVMLKSQGKKPDEKSNPLVSEESAGPSSSNAAANNLEIAGSEPLVPQCAVETSKSAEENVVIKLPGPELDAGVSEVPPKCNGKRAALEPAASREQLSDEEATIRIVLPKNKRVRVEIITE